MASTVRQKPVATQPALKILRLSAENILRLSAVEIDANGAPVVVIAGDNEAGKSAVLAAIEMALGGEKRLPAEPIRRGQKSGKVVLDLGDIVVTRSFTASGSKLVVTNRDGLKYPSPQSMLDGLVSRLTFDPLAFAEADEKTQATTLRQLAGINTDDLDEDRKAVFDERTLVNRDVTQLQGALAKAPKHVDAPAALIDVSALAAQLQEADELADAATFAAAKAREAASATTAAKDLIKARLEVVDRARRALADAEAALVAAEETLVTASKNEQRLAVAATAAREAVPSRDELRAQMARAEVVNAKVRDNLARQELEQQIAAKKAESDALTSRIAAIEQQKVDRLGAATFPVDGLGLSDAGVTWNGLPFSQASTAIRIRASAAIGFALNPRLKVLRIQNGNDLGAKNLKLLAELAAAQGAQVWVERIAGGDGLFTVVIEDGTVVATSGEAVAS